jgi:PAS domain S-box-containing protein
MTPVLVPDELCRLLDSATDPTVLMDEAGRIAFVNTRAEELFGYGRDELIGRPADLLIPEWVGADGPDAGPRVPPGRANGRRKDGTAFPVRMSRSRMRLDGRFALVIVTAGSAPSAADEPRPWTGADPFRTGYEDAGPPMGLTDLDDRFVRVNAAFARTVGYSPAELVGVRSAAVTHPDDRPAAAAGRASLLAGERLFVQTEQRYLHRDGHVLWALAHVSLVRAGPTAPLYLTQVRDVTARKVAEWEARHGAGRFRAFFEASTAGMIEVEPDGQIVFANGAFCRMLGYAPAELGALSAADVLFPEDRARVLAQDGAVAAGRVPSCEADRRYRRKDGSALWTRVSVVPQDEVRTPTRVSAVVVDLTDRKQLEEQYRHAQKMAAVGLRASGIAHDFNNLLTVINGCAETVLGRLPTADPTRELVQEMTAACRRAAGLTAQLLAFGRKGAHEQRLLNLNEVVARSVRLLHPLLGPGVTLVADLADDSLGVKADAAQLEQVILNLGMNAKDAMPRGGSLTVEAHAVRVGAEDRSAYPDLPPGEYVRLAVSDTGAGMTDEVRAQAFEPFFTTKEVGKGTGLGLAIVHGAVRQCGGRVDVYSEPGVGTILAILLPVGAPGAGAVRPVPRGAETVLVVEPEADARKLARLALRAHGYRVIEAAGAAEGVRLAREHAGPIDLLVAAAGLPEVGGREPAELLRAIHPGMKTISTGGSGGLPGAFLPDPVTPMTLAHKVRAVLDGDV